MICIAAVLRMCGLDKVTKFSLPPTPVQVQYDYKLPDNSWTTQEFVTELRSNPKAQMISNSVQAEMQSSGKQEWTQTDIMNFVNSPKFEEAMNKAKEMEANLRPVTEADLGIKPTKGKNKPSHKKPEKGNLKGNKKGKVK